MKSSVDEGEKILSGDKYAGHEGAFTELVLTGLKPVIADFDEELFRPVASFYEVNNLQAGIGLANDSDFGLGASDLTQDTKRSIKIAVQIDTGMVFVNHF